MDGGNGMVDKGGKGGVKVMRGDVGYREVVRVVRWDMSSVYGGGYIVGNLSGGEGGGRVGAAVCPSRVDGKLVGWVEGICVCWVVVKVCGVGLY